MTAKDTDNVGGLSKEQAAIAFANGQQVQVHYHWLDPDDWRPVGCFETFDRPNTKFRIYGELCRAAPAGGDEPRLVALEKLVDEVKYLVGHAGPEQRMCSGLARVVSAGDFDDVVLALSAITEKQP